jgi:DNA-binding MarR family transcriptional regulator
MDRLLASLYQAERVETALRACANAVGLNRTQILVLAHMSRTPAPRGDEWFNRAATASALAEASGLQRSTISMQLPGLLELGLLRRADDHLAPSGGGPKPVYELTERGKTRARAVRAALRAAEAELFGPADKRS